MFYYFKWKDFRDIDDLSCSTISSYTEQMRRWPFYTHPQAWQTFPELLPLLFISVHKTDTQIKPDRRLVYMVETQEPLWTMSRNRQNPTPTTPSGSHVLEATENEYSAQFPRILRLRGEDSNTSSSRNNDEDASNRRIRWSEDVVDNEGMGKKKSKGNK